MRNLMTDAERLWGTLMETAAIGGTAKGGICRLTLTELDREVRDWFSATTAALGCTVTTDDMGTMFARREGQRRDVPPIAIGSHLDTQPTGGKFDGTLGVLAALEVLRTLHQAGYETFAPIEVVNWTNEEGSRFTPPMMASGVFAGVFTRDWAYNRTDPDGLSFGSALDADRPAGGPALRRSSPVGVFRAAYRAGANPRGGRHRHRRRHGRAGHPLVRGDGHRPGRAHRCDTDASAQECAARRRPHRGDCRGDRAGACAGGGGDRGVDAGEAELAERCARRSLLDHRHAPSRVARPWRRWRPSSTRRLPPWANRSDFRSRRPRSGISRP